MGAGCLSCSAGCFSSVIVVRVSVRVRRGLAVSETGSTGSLAVIGSSLRSVQAVAGSRSAFVRPACSDLPDTRARRSPSAAFNSIAADPEPQVADLLGRHQFGELSAAICLLRNVNSCMHGRVADHHFQDAAADIPVRVCWPNVGPAACCQACAYSEVVFTGRNRVGPAGRSPHRPSSADLAGSVAGWRCPGRWLRVRPLSASVAHGCALPSDGDERSSTSPRRLAGDGTGQPLWLSAVRPRRMKSLDPDLSPRSTGARGDLGGYAHFGSSLLSRARGMTT